MKRKIISIDREVCTGCGLCADACHENAIEMKDGKAYLVRDDYCDGLGDCLPACPAGAIKIEEREAAEYSPEAVASRKNGRLSNWPVQIKLAPVNAPYYENADLLIAADCTAFAFMDLHSRFIRNKVTLIGCSKLDSVDYSEKLTSIISGNDIKSVTVMRMEVPCCGGLETAVRKALQQSGKFIPWHVAVISIDGNIISE